MANLRSMYGMKLISVESIILKYLPKKVAHSMTLDSVNVRRHVLTPATLTSSLSTIHTCIYIQEIANLVRKEPSHVSLEWVLRLLQHYIESDPDQIFVIDLVPSLRYD